MVLKVIILFQFLVFNHAYSQGTNPDCADADVSDKNPKLREMFSTPRNQDSIGWCYGFSAADLISAELGESVSAFHSSAIYNKHIDNNFLEKTNTKLQQFFSNSSELKQVYEGGFVGAAIAYAVKEGSICTEKAMPYDADYSGQVMKLVKDLEFLKTLVENSKLSENDICEEVKSKIPVSLSILPNTKYLDVYHALLKGELNQELEKMISKSCAGNKLAVPKFKVKHLYPPMIDHNTDWESERTKYFKKIGDLLAIGKPIAIDYELSHVSSQKGAHVSVVVAKRWNRNKNKCEYKIRNSWGQSCYLNKNVECVREEGSFWVDEGIFYEMVSDITYIAN